MVTCEICRTSDHNEDEIITLCDYCYRNTLDKKLILALVGMIEQHCYPPNPDGSYFAGYLSANSWAFNVLIEAGFAKAVDREGEVCRSDSVMLDKNKIEKLGDRW